MIWILCLTHTVFPTVTVCFPGSVCTQYSLKQQLPLNARVQTAEVQQGKTDWLRCLAVGGREGQWEGEKEFISSAIPHCVITMQCTVWLRNPIGHSPFDVLVYQLCTSGRAAGHDEPRGEVGRLLRISVNKRTIEQMDLEKMKPLATCF